MNNELVSFTTRKPRQGEVDGVDYIFITPDEFHELERSGGLMESTKYGENFYGLLQREFDEKISRESAFFICDYNGMKQMKAIYKNCYSIFILSEIEDIEQRMLTRGDSEDSIKKRLSTYNDEISNLVFYDEVVSNYQYELEDTILTMKDIINEVENPEYA
jgi:guanylate kinase